MEETEKLIFTEIDSVCHETVWSSIPSDQILFHYTNCDSLISIIQKNEYWLSSVELMNDKEEVDYSLKLVTDVVGKLIIPQARKDELLNSFLKYKKTSAINTFVLSLSFEQDALILWNNYGKNEGYNLGISLATFLDYLNTNKVEIVNDSTCILVNGRVLYESELQTKLLLTLFKAYYDLYVYKQERGVLKPETDISVSKIWKMIILYSSLVKSDLHRMENEYRVLLTIPDDSKAIEFRSRNGLVLPYIKMKMKTFDYLKKITIGPKIDDKIADESLKYFIEKNVDKFINLDKSDLKLRF